MNGPRATVVFSVAVVVVVAVGCQSLSMATATTTTPATQLHRQLEEHHRPPPSNRSQTAADGDCRTGWWPQCVVRQVVRTIRLLEDSDSWRIAEGVRLVKSAAADNDRSAKNRTSDVFDRMASFVDGHSLEIDLWTPDNSVIAKGRRRHAYRKVFPIIVGTYMIMSAVLIPMGFMFMSTLGGKALLISKMALIISLMSNIKKIFSYEYYVPSAPAQPHHHWKRTLQLAHRTTAGPLYSSYTAY